jgi:hypothetical protein
MSQDAKPMSPSIGELYAPCSLFFWDKLQLGSLYVNEETSVRSVWIPESHTRTNR